MPQAGALIGLDFGMTNSLLTYFDEASGLVAHTGPGGDAFAIPTVVEFKLDDAPAGGEQTPIGRFVSAVQQGLARVGSLFGFTTITIGRPALWAREARRNFKSRLAPSARLSEPERHRNDAYLATKAYLHGLFEEFLDDYEKVGGTRQIGSIVVTVPEAWVRGDELGGVEALRQVFSELQLPTPIFLSEPFAAACYFAYLHGKRTGSEFRGHVLVYDHGGSTLDISIVSIDGQRIREVGNFGSGLLGSDEGFGGVYFDQLVLAHIADRTGMASLARLRDAETNDIDRTKWLSELERMKRDRSSLIEAASRNGAIECVGSIGDIEILSSDFLAVFEKNFADKIRAALQGAINRALAREPFDMGDAAHFRVISVGGFSEFPPLQKLINDYFASLSGEDVLRSYFGLNDRWQAVSKGACLIAAENVHIDFRCPFTFGFIAYVGIEPLDNELLVYGRPQTDYAAGVYGNKLFGPGYLKDRHRLEFYIESGGRRRILPMQDGLADILPDFDRKDNKWRACGVIRDGEVEVHFKSEQTGTESSVRVGKLMAMIDGPIEV
jgi:molecular chaperone DnaK (HSP70)